jgi:hypothetical protein
MAAVIIGLVQYLGKIRPFYAREGPSPPEGRPAAGGLVHGGGTTPVVFGLW